MVVNYGGDANDIEGSFGAKFLYATNCTQEKHYPIGSGSGSLWCASYGNLSVQIFYKFGENTRTYIRVKSVTWGAWMEISTDIPSFYKNYSDLASLASALGVDTLFKIRRLPTGTSLVSDDAKFATLALIPNPNEYPSSAVASSSSFAIVFNLDGGNGYVLYFDYNQSTIYFAERMASSLRWKKIAVES